MTNVLYYWDVVLTTIVRFPKTLQAVRFTPVKSLSQRRNPSVKEQSLLLKRLALLLRSGIPIGTSLRVLASSDGKINEASRLFPVITLVEAGVPFSQACSRGGYPLTPFAQNLIRIGEVSGTLPENLEYIAVTQKQQYELRTQLLQSLIYPAIIVAATLAISIFLVVVIFPKIVPILTSVEGALPWSTKALMSISAFMMQYWLWLLTYILVLVPIIFFLRRVPAVAYTFADLTLRLPIVGRLSQSYQVASSCRTLSVLLASEARIGDALAIVSRSTSHMVYQKAWQSISKTVITGQRLSTDISHYPRLFPSVVVQMVMVGETTGNLSHTLRFIAELYESDVKDVTKNLTTLLEPLLMLAMGLVVGFIAISIITPIYGITQQLHT